MRATVATNETYSPGKLYLKSPFLLLRIRRIYQITFLTTVIGGLGACYALDVSITNTLIALSAIVFLNFAIYQLLKRFVTGSLHGDHLIVTHRLTNKSKVVDVRHIRKIKAVNFMGICGTRFTYSLDGEIRKVVLLCAGSEHQQVAKYLQEIKKAA